MVEPEYRLPFPFAASSSLAEKGSDALHVPKVLAEKRPCRALVLGRAMFFALCSQNLDLALKSDKQEASRTVGHCACHLDSHNCVLFTMRAPFRCGCEQADDATTDEAAHTLLRDPGDARWCKRCGSPPCVVPLSSPAMIGGQNSTLAIHCYIQLPTQPNPTRLSPQPGVEP